MYGWNTFLSQRSSLLWVKLLLSEREWGEGMGEAQKLPGRSSTPASPQSCLDQAGLRRVSIRMDCRSLEGAGAPAEPTSWGSWAWLLGSELCPGARHPSGFLTPLSPQSSSPLSLPLTCSLRGGNRLCSKSHGCRHWGKGQSTGLKVTQAGGTEREGRVRERGPPLVSRNLDGVLYNTHYCSVSASPCVSRNSVSGG